jgi:hypothetical protein
VRLLNLIERSGARTVAGIKKWQSQLPKDSDPDLLRGFSTESAHETVDCYFVKDVEMEPERENIKGENLGSQSDDDDGEGGQGGRGGSTGLARLDAFEMAGRFQEAIAAEREKAAAAARADERRVAEAELAAMKRVAEAQMAAEQARGSARASASRLYAIVGVIVALVAGTVIGVTWSRSQTQADPVVQVPQGVQPQHQVAPSTDTKPEPKVAPPVDQPTEKPKEGGETAVPKDTEKLKNSEKSQESVKP